MGQAGRAVEEEQQQETGSDCDRQQHRPPATAVAERTGGQRTGHACAWRGGGLLMRMAGRRYVGRISESAGRAIEASS